MTNKRVIRYFRDFLNLSFRALEGLACYRWHISQKGAKTSNKKSYLRFCPRIPLLVQTLPYVETFTVTLSPRPTPFRLRHCGKTSGKGAQRV